MNINIKVIPHEQQRYPTVGDWWYEPDGTIEIRVSAMSDWRHESLVALHELVEVLLCKQDGVTQGAVDDFDKAFEEKRAKGELKDENAEPGDEADAPYQKQHCIASGVERLIAANLGVVWSPYADEVEAFP
jgi:hypothetical protein